MAREPDNAVLVILRDIQQTLAEHGRRFDKMDQRFEGIEKRLDDIHEGMVTALGMSAHAHVRHDSVERRLDELTRRVEKLEEKA